MGSGGKGVGKHVMGMAGKKKGTIFIKVRKSLKIEIDKSEKE